MLQISHKMFRNMIFGYRNFDRFEAIFFLIIYIWLPQNK